MVAREGLSRLAVALRFWRVALWWRVKGCRGVPRGVRHSRAWRWRLVARGGGAVNAKKRPWARRAAWREGLLRLTQEGGGSGCTPPHTRGSGLCECHAPRTWACTLGICLCASRAHRRPTHRILGTFLCVCHARRSGFLCNRGRRDLVVRVGNIAECHTRRNDLSVYRAGIRRFHRSLGIDPASDDARISDYRHNQGSMACACRGGTRCKSYSCS